MDDRVSITAIERFSGAYDGRLHHHRDSKVNEQHVEMRLTIGSLSTERPLDLCVVKPIVARCA